VTRHYGARETGAVIREGFACTREIHDKPWTTLERASTTPRRGASTSHVTTLGTRARCTCIIYEPSARSRVSSVVYLLKYCTARIIAKFF